ncbi:MAG: hypoxanthine phosphoribosyltransferase [Clostridia bacterium]|nr:hypoxanthine phosphoribosyltransferase [Clostridia bacterium]
MLHKDIKKVLITAEEIQKRTDEIAARISKDYEGEPILMVCILRGAVLFFADLVRKINAEINFDFMAVSSYGAGLSSSGEVRIMKDISGPIQGKNVIIVEDIIDSGNTLCYLKRLLKQRHPKSIRIAALLDKPERREADIEGDYIGFKVPNEFVVGYGLDYNEKYRNLPDVCVLKPEVYEK